MLIVVVYIIKRIKEIIVKLMEKVKGGKIIIGGDFNARIEREGRDWDKKETGKLGNLWMK